MHTKIHYYSVKNLTENTLVRLFYEFMFTIFRVLLMMKSALRNTSSCAVSMQCKLIHKITNSTISFVGFIHTFNRFITNP